MTETNQNSRFYSKSLFFALLFWSVFFIAPGAKAERLPVKIYTSADGLGSSFVDYLMRDSRGFMWFCTRDGLSRFDGSQFITYKIGDKSSPPGIETIYETRDGTYWISTTGGLYRFKPDILSPPDSSGGRPMLNAEFIDNSRGNMLEDSQGNFWYGTGGLSLIENRDGEKIEFKKALFNLPTNPNRNFGVTGMREASDKSVWFNTSWGLARRLPDGRVIFYESPTDATQGNSSMLTDADGRIWLTRGLGLIIIKPETVESLSNPEQLTVRSLNPTAALTVEMEKEISLPENAGEILSLTSDDFSLTFRLYQTSDKHVWLTTAKGLIEFDGRAFHLHDEAQGFLPGMASMMEDAAGNLWIGGRTGLIRLDRKGLTSYGKGDGFQSASIFAISEAADGTLYFADSSRRLNKFDGKKFQSLRPQLAPNPTLLWTSRYAFLDSRNEWWILTSEKLYRFAASDLSAPIAVYTSKDGLKADAMFQIFEDSRGDIWVSVQPNKDENLGLARFERSENKFHTFTEAEGFPSYKSVSSFAEDTRGNLWFGFYEGGIARFSNNRFTAFLDEFPRAVITDLHVDRKGRLWLASVIEGLLRIDDTSAETPQIIRFTTADGLSSNNIRTITEDGFGRIYIGTARGVDRISPDTGKVKHYSIADGLASDFVVDSHCDKSGNLWFATTGGLSKLTPLEDGKVSAPKVFLGGLRIAGVEQSISKLGGLLLEKGELTHTENNFQIDFFGLDSRAGETLRYQYRLEGAASDDWSAASEQRTVTYGNLSPATYRFLVRAVNSDGIVSEKPAIVSFKILPPVWARWWFILLCALLAAAVIILLYRYRTARLREINSALSEANRAEEDLRKSREERLAELEKVRIRIATDLHDDIGASLTQIAVLSEVAQAQSGSGGKNGGAASEPLTKISSVSNELVEAMSDIVWSINPAKDHLHDLTQRMRRFASDVLSAKGVNFQFVAPVAENDISIGTNLRREVFLIFKESVNNIVKHSGAKQVRIELKISGQDIMLEISDDGKGFMSEPPAVAGGLSVENSHVGENPFATANGSDKDGKGGNGITSMRRRAAEMNGSFEIVSEAGQGTKIILRLPLEQTAQTGGDIGKLKIKS